MQDEIIKQTGNSRYLMSAIGENAPWEEARALFRAGKFPVDFNGKNPEGIAQEGTPLTTANLLSEATAETIADATGGKKPETVDEALKILGTGKVKFRYGEYKGTGTYGPTSRNEIQSDIIPKIVIISAHNFQDYTSQSMHAYSFGVLTPENALCYTYVINKNSAGFSCAISLGENHVDFSGKIISWYNNQHSAFAGNPPYTNTAFTNEGAGSPQAQLNYIDFIYKYTIIGTE